MKPYLIPAHTHRTEIIIVNSRFITTVGFADTVEKARKFIAAVREEMPDASHHVYAFCIGYGKSTTEGMSDDGEPSGTSGPPTLAVLRGADIGDVVLVTTRYFGGTKLGTGGLVRAYTESAQTALASLKTRSNEPWHQFLLELPYSLYDPLKTVLDEYEVNVIDTDFTTSVLLQIAVRESFVSTLKDALREASAGTVELIRVAD